MNHSIAIAAVAAILGLSGNAGAGTDSVPVSPGGIEAPELATGSCPTFSWTESAAETEGYEIAIWKLTDDGPAEEITLRRALPSGALSWTPSQSECLDRGGEFAWSVRALHSTQPGSWASPRLFATPSGPSEHEVEAVLAALGRYVEAGGSLDSLIERRSTHPDAAVDSSERPASRTGPRPRVSAKPKQPEKQPEDALRTASSATLEPAQKRGISSTTAAPSASSAVAVEGVYDSSDTQDIVGGLLGVSVPDTSTETFLSPYLKWLDENEIGVLGFSGNDSWDNIGVAGVGGDSAWGGAFLHSDAAGVVDNIVLLGGEQWAMDVNGDVRIRGGSITCPLGTVRVGAWCISTSRKSPKTFQNALKGCWDQGMQLCHLDAVMACDYLEPVGAACTADTDTDDSTFAIWLGDLEPVHMWEGLDPNHPNEVFMGWGNVWVDGEAWLYVPIRQTLQGAVRNVLDDSSKGELHPSYCCTMPR